MKYKSLTVFLTGQCELFDIRKERSCNEKQSCRNKSVTFLSILVYFFQKFRSLHPEIVNGRSTFARIKPFWIKKPRIQDRDTCLCKIHKNSLLVHKKLKCDQCREKGTVFYSVVMQR